MPRLADYFMVVGYDENKEQSSTDLCAGSVIQRFPEKDWPDCPYTEGIELFCEPSGWRKRKGEPLPARFFVSVLTNMNGGRSYCASLTFQVIHEPDSMHASILKSLPAGLTSDMLDISEPSSMYSAAGAAGGAGSRCFVPKSLVLVSRLPFFDVLRNCLGLIYTAYTENMDIELETLIGNLLGCLYVPAFGGVQIRFSIGAGDRQAIQPPLSETVPISCTCITTLFKRIGISNVLTLFCAALSDHKILFHSASLSQLTDSCHAITVLMYPLQYTYVYIPILPLGLIEILMAPTPFIAGVNSSVLPDTSELLDVIIVDIDGGHITIPDQIVVHTMPEPMLSALTASLNMILHVDLLRADHAFHSENQKPPMSSEMKDKSIRAVFLRFFAQLLHGYRSCLKIIRIHPEPFITFHRASYLGARSLVDDEFSKKVFDSMCFNQFVNERGSPYRVCDLFDQVFASMPETAFAEQMNNSLIEKNIEELAIQLLLNEMPNRQPYAQKVPRPPDGVHLRLHQREFPKLCSDKVQKVIDEGVEKQEAKVKVNPDLVAPRRAVPSGVNLAICSGGGSGCLTSCSTTTTTTAASSGSAHASTECLSTERRLQVMKNCLAFIFDGQISEARKIIPSVIRTLKSASARQSLVRELHHYSTSNPDLKFSQYDLVIRLINIALQHDSANDEYGIAAGIVPIACKFYRDVGSNIIQFAYTSIQEHLVWSNVSFWENCFYQDVESEVRNAYLDIYTEQASSNMHPAIGGTSQAKQLSAMQIAAIEIDSRSTRSKSELQYRILREEQAILGQAKHYCNTMISMLMPLTPSKQHVIVNDGASSIINSMAESDSYDTQSVYDDGMHVGYAHQALVTTTKFIQRFIDKVCSDGDIAKQHVKDLHNNLSPALTFHLEMLMEVNEKVAAIPKVKKAKLQEPELLPGEVKVHKELRAYLFADGRAEACNHSSGGPLLLPADGAVYLTQYRVIFKGVPVDLGSTEQVVSRSFPVSSLFKEKKITMDKQAMDSIYQTTSHECLQLRSNTFQFMKLAFDDNEVSAGEIDRFRKNLLRLTSPVDVMSTFAFIGQRVGFQFSDNSTHKKSATLKGYAKRKLMKGVRKAGLKTKEPSIKRKYVMPTPPMSRKSMTLSAVHSDQFGSRPSSICIEENLTPIDERNIQNQIDLESKSMHSLFARIYLREFDRQGLLNIQAEGHPSNPQYTCRDGLRLSFANQSYELTSSYPSLLIVPRSFTDDQLRKLAKNHRHNRFPVITYKNCRTKCLLLRSSAKHSKGVINMIRKHPNSTSKLTVNESNSSSSIDEEYYFKYIVGLNKFKKSQSKRKSVYPNHHMGGLVEAARNGMKRVPLYIFTEKHLLKQIKIDNYSDCDFLPIELADSRAVKSSFKKFMKACIPSFCESDDAFKKNQKPHDEKEDKFLSNVENSGWLSQISDILCTSSAVADILEIGSSVIVSLEEGEELTTQLVSLAQVISEPFYRTIEGLKVLIEKDWLSFGYKFTTKGAQTANSQQSGFVPIFLQFLDALHQIQRQCPSSFEYNDYLLQFLAYHSMSNCFKTFMMDNESERMSSGCLLSDSSSSENSIWEYISYYHKKKTIFYNFLYDSSRKNIIRVSHSLSNLDVWDFYLVESLAEGSKYDFFVVDKENTAMEDRMLIEQDSDTDCDSRLPRRIVNSCYDNLPRAVPNAFNYLLEHADKLKEELDEVNEENSDWLKMWKSIDHLQPMHTSPANDANSSAFWSCQATNELMARSKLFSEVASSYRDYHKFEKFNFTTPEYCDYCSKIICYIKGMTCTQCHYKCHEKCASHALRNCTPAHPQSRSGSVLGQSSPVTAASAATLPASAVFSSPSSPSSSSSKSAKAAHGAANTTIARAPVGSNGTTQHGSTPSSQHLQHQHSLPEPSSTSRLTNTTTEDKEKTLTPQSVGYHGDRDGSSSTPQTTSATIGPNTQHAKPLNVVTPKKSQSGEVCRYKGFLYKRGAFLKGWKQRYFILDSMKHQLSYYDDRPQGIVEPRGSIDLSEVMTVMLLKAVQGAPKRTNDNSFFELKTTKRVYNFGAEDGTTAMKWINAIQSCIQ